MKDSNQCKGCRAYDEAACVVIDAEIETDNCPCFSCLVKGMCMDSCRDYDKFWRGKMLDREHAGII